MNDWQTEMCFKIVGFGIPLTLLVGFIALLPAGLKSEIEIVRSSRFWSNEMNRSMQILKGNIVLIFFPVASSLIVSLLCGATVYAALRQGGHKGSASSYGALLLIVRDPRLIAAYLITGFAFFLLQAILIRYFFSSRNVNGGLFSAAGYVLGRMGDIFLLSMVLFGGLLIFRTVLEKALRNIVEKLSNLGIPGLAPLVLAIEMASLFIESGTMISADIILVIMISEDLGLRESIPRFREILRKECREALNTNSRLEALRIDNLAGAALCPFLISICSILPIFMLTGDGPSLSQRLGLPLYITDAHLVFILGCFLSVVSASFIFSLIQALDCIFSVGIYQAAKGSALAWGFEQKHFAVLTAPQH